MDIQDLLDERIIRVGLDVKDKDDVLQKMSIMLKDAGYIEDMEAFLKDIYLRESQGCTGIGNYIAIPHGKSAYVSKVGVAIAKLKNEIEWESLDNKGVKFIFLFAVGDKTEDAVEHLRLIAQVSRKLGNDEAVRTLLNAKSVEEIKSVFL